MALGVVARWGTAGGEKHQRCTGAQKLLLFPITFIKLQREGLLFNKLENNTIGENTLVASTCATIPRRTTSAGTPDI